MSFLAQLIPVLTRNCLKEGYMEKTGPTVCYHSESICLKNTFSLIFFFEETLFCFFQQRELFKKRWFTLCSVNRKLLYFKTPLVIINILYLLWNLLWVLIDCLNKKHDRSPMLCCPFFFFFTFRMLLSLAPSSSAPRTTATLFRRELARVQGAAGGTAASRCTHQTGSLCSCVSRSRSKRSGWRPSEKSSLSPWPQKTTKVRNCCCNGMESVYK